MLPFRSFLKPLLSVRIFSLLLVIESNPLQYFSIEEIYTRVVTVDLAYSISQKPETITFEKIKK